MISYVYKTFAQGVDFDIVQHLVLERFVFQPLDERFVLLLDGLLALLGFLGVVQLDAFLGDVLELFAVEFGQRLDAVLVHGLDQVQHLVTFLQKPLHKRRPLNLQEKVHSVINSAFQMCII